MHQCEISAYALDRAKGRLNPVPPPLQPSKVAHIIIDLQNAFVAPGAPVEVPVCRDIIPNVNKISNAVRTTGGVNVFVRFTVDDAEPKYWASMHRRTNPQSLDAMRSMFAPGNVTHDLWPDLDVDVRDIITNKTRFSALTPGTCDLQTILQERSIETVIITGTMTNCCCEATARDAMQLGYSVLLIQDGCAAHDDAMHNNTLSNLVAFGYADVCTTDDALKRLG
jgi:ureidoacrylate peracid hydrolase